MLVPVAARHRDRVERFPIEPPAADHAVSSSVERDADQACVPPLRAGTLSWPQKLAEEGHRRIDCPAGNGIRIFDHDRVPRIAVVVAKRVEQFQGSLPSVHVHRRMPPGAAGVIDESRPQPAVAVGSVRVVVAKTGGLLAPPDLPAALLFGISVFEAGCVERFRKRQIEDAHVDGEFVAVIAVIVPGVRRREHHVARTESDGFAFNAREIPAARQADPHGVDRMAMRRHDFAGVVQAIGRVKRGHRGANRRQARIDQDDRAAFRVVHRDQLRRVAQQRFDVGVFPCERRRAAPLQNLPVLVVVFRVVANRPVGRHVERVEPVVERREPSIAVACRHASLVRRLHGRQHSI